MKLFDEAIFFILVQLFGETTAETISDDFLPYFSMLLSGTILFTQFIWPKVNLVQEKLWLSAVVLLFFSSIALALF